MSEPYYRVLSRPHPLDTDTLNQLYYEGWEFIQTLGPITTHHDAGGLPGGLDTTEFVAYFKRR